MATRVPPPRVCSPSLWSLISSYSKISQILKGLRAKRACAGYVSPAKQEEAPEGGTDGRMDGLCVPPHRPWAASAGRKEARVEEAAGFMQWPEKLFCSKPGSACSELAWMVTRPRGFAPASRGVEAAPCTTVPLVGVRGTKALPDLSSLAGGVQNVPPGSAPAPQS